MINIGADDTCQDIKSIELVKTEFPELTDIRSDLSEYQPIYCNKKAKEILGWKPVHFRRDYVSIQ